MTHRLAVVAHYDPDGFAAPHVLRQLEQLGAFVDDLVVATTSTLTSEAREALKSRAELVERENFGQDFGGWQQVLLDRKAAEAYDEVLLTNDSYVGLLRPLEQLFAEMSSRSAEIWGTHESLQLHRHLQSFFVVFTEPALRSRAFAEFWRRMRPAASRWKAIVNQEVGLSQHMLRAGFDIAAYFTPNERDEALVASRRRWWKEQGRNLDVSEGRKPRKMWPLTGNMNPAVAFADAALDDGRMPLVKFDTLRYDPYFLGSDRLLALCEERYPAEFEGVREFLERTAASYPIREGENNGHFEVPPEFRDTIGYHVPGSATS